MPAEVAPHLHRITDIIGLSPATAQVIYRPFSFFFTTTPLDVETLAIFSMAQTIILPADFNGSTAHIGVNPTSSFLLTVKQNDTTTIGTILTTSNGSVTWSTVNHISYVLEPEDWLSIVAQDPPDQTIANCSFTLLGTVSG